MSGDKLEYVKEAAIHALRLLTEQDRVSVVIYDDAVEVLAPSQAITGTTRADLIERLRQLRTGGMTNLSGGWFTGCDQIADYVDSNYLNRALLLTDGLANQGLTDHERLVHEAKELRRRGITTTTFGVGHDFNQFLLQGIADAGGGHFYFIDKPDEIPHYFEGELGELLATVARETTLDIIVPAGVELELLNDAPFERRGELLRLFLGDAYANEARVLVLKLKLPAHPAGDEFTLAFTLHYEDAQQRRPVMVGGETIRFTVASPQACEKQPVNDHVLKEAGRLEAEKAKMEALKKEYSGDVTGAQQALRRAGVTLQAMPSVAGQAFVADLDEAEQKIAAGLTPAERKQRHYATYMAQRSRKDYKKR
jgi:Ca-activated chloride channel family protein